MKQKKYEALVKITTNINESLSDEEKATSLYQTGDIVVVRPKGWTWGREELKHFLVVGLPSDILEEEANLLEVDIGVEYYEKDSELEESINEESLTEQLVLQQSVRRRRHKIDIDELLDTILLSQEEYNKIFDRGIIYQPFKNNAIKRFLIEDKIDRKETQNVIRAIQNELVIKKKRLPNKNVISLLQEKKLRGRKIIVE